MEMTSREAAQRLHVSDRQVRRLVAAGDLRSRILGGRLLVDMGAVDQRLQSTPGRGRPMSARAAWGVLWELSGERAAWLSATERSRLRARLRTATAESLALAVRRRAVRHDLRVVPQYLEAVVEADDVVAGGISAAQSVDADVVGLGAAEVYCTASTLDELRRRFGLSERGDANVTVRVPILQETPLLTGRDTMPAAVVAMDLLESPDVRTRRAGHDVAERLFTSRRGNIAA
jgi:excisionase family DNA binding protein